MYAVVEFAGHQYKVQKGDELVINRVATEEGKKFTVDTVLATFSEEGKDAKLGAPYLSGAKVEFKVIEHGLDDKVRVFKMKSKKRYRVNKGFRQAISKVEVVAVA